MCDYLSEVRVKGLQMVKSIFLIPIVSGASKLQAFSYSIGSAGIDASGASRADVSVGNRLVVNASGASSVQYWGTPVMEQRLSGSSSVQNDKWTPAGRVWELRVRHSAGKAGNYRNCLLCQPGNLRLNAYL